MTFGYAREAIPPLTSCADFFVNIPDAQIHQKHQSLAGILAPAAGLAPAEPQAFDPKRFLEGKWKQCAPSVLRAVQRKCTARKNQKVWSLIPSK